MLGDPDQPGGGQQRMPALAAHPQAVLALVREVPGACVQAPGEAGDRARELKEQQEAAVTQLLHDVGQPNCMIRRRGLGVLVPAYGVLSLEVTALAGDKQAGALRTCDVVAGVDGVGRQDEVEGATQAGGRWLVDVPHLRHAHALL